MTPKEAMQSLINGDTLTCLTTTGYRDNKTQKFCMLLPNGKYLMLERQKEQPDFIRGEWIIFDEDRPTLLIEDYEEEQKNKEDSEK